MDILRVLRCLWLANRGDQSKSIGGSKGSSGGRASVT